MFYRIQVRRLSWTFHSLQTVTLKTLNNLNSVMSCIIIHQNEIVTNRITKILLVVGTKWSSTSCGTAVVPHLLAERDRKWSSTGVEFMVGLEHVFYTQNLHIDINPSLNHTARHIETSCSISLGQLYFHPSDCPAP
ncbi:hypothetical protein TNCV_4425271 [Trichonephila clavipes]|nr:hypothetical protein TNCV_4425271 [Trichonephila clavipes]